MELLFLKVMADALDPDSIDLITSNDHLTTMLAVIVAAGAFAIRFFFKKGKQVKK